MKNNRALDGQPVRDATADTVITIQHRDINHGKPNSPGECPAARACCRGLHATEALIYRTKTYLRNGKGWTRYVTPASLRTELVAFDRGGRMMPGDHIIRAPKGTERLGRHKPTGPKSRSGKPRRKWHLTESVRERAPNLHEKPN
jgi:hypothetical protein